MNIVLEMAGCYDNTTQYDSSYDNNNSSLLYCMQDIYPPPPKHAHTHTHTHTDSKHVEESMKDLKTDKYVCV